MIAGYNVVLVHLPDIGGHSAARAASSLRSSFTGIKLALVVGICGIVPFDLNQEEIVLGDCIISTAVVHFDIGRQGPKGFKRKDGLDGLGRLNTEIRAVLAKCQTTKNKERLTQNLFSNLEQLQVQEAQCAAYPGVNKDRLFESSYAHTHRPTTDSCADCQLDLGICNQDCAQLGCDGQHLLRRRRLDGVSTIKPKIHFGHLGSSNTVLKSGSHRDTISKLDKLIAFEMEGAGVWDTYPTIVIKSGCDYADSHKSKEWQGYAASVAAAGLRAFVGSLELPDEDQTFEGKS